MSRRSKPAEQVDLGPEVQHERGDLVVEKVPHPTTPRRATARARRAWVPDILLGRGSITPAGHAACVRYLATHERGVLGGRERSRVYVDYGYTPAGPSDTQLAALTDFRKAEQVVGTRLGEALTWCVLGHASMESLARHKGMTGHHASGYVIAGVERLAEHYGY